MNRLRSYRWIEGINQNELGQVLGISSQLVSAIESGRRSATCDLSKLGYADHRLELAEMTEPLHRQSANTSVASTRRAKELMRLAGEVFIDLRGYAPIVPYGRLERLGPTRSCDEAAEHADEVRVAVLGKDAHGPIRNLTADVERAGICLLPLTGLSGVDGLSSWVEGQPVVGLSADVAGDRFRFSLAHEIGHLVMHTKKSQVSEAEAHRFASALLMPDDEFEAAMPPHPVLSDFVALKNAWGISAAALVYRAHQRGFLDDRRYRSVQIQMSKWRKREPGRFDPKPGTFLPWLVREAGGVGACARDLGVHEDHLRQIATWRHLKAV